MGLKQLVTSQPLRGSEAPKEYWETVSFLIPNNLGEAAELIGGRGEVGAGRD